MFAYNGTIKTTPGHRDDIVKLLLRGSEGLREAGCHLYVVSISEEEPDRVFVNEVWESAEKHRASLELPQVKAAISEAMPMLTGEFTGQHLTVVGGLGVPASAE